MKEQYPIQENLYSTNNYNKNSPYPVSYYSQQYPSVTNWNTFSNPEQLAIQSKAGIRYNDTNTIQRQYGLNQIYPNAEPFRNDLDKKLTLIEYEDMYGENEMSRQVRLIKTSTLIPPEVESEAEDSGGCLSVCCLIILVIGIIGVALSVYILKDSQNSVVHSFFNFSHKEQLPWRNHHLSFRS